MDGRHSAKGREALAGIGLARDRQRLRLAIDELEGGFVGDVKKLQGMPETYRRRVGDWRIIFQIDFGTRRITVLRVAQRGSAYCD